MCIVFLGGEHQSGLKIVDGFIETRIRFPAKRIFSEERIRQFLRYRRKHDSKRRGDNATLRSLLKHLREATVVGPPVSQDRTSPLDQLQASFAQHLREQRGLRPATLEQYLFHTRRFLSERF